MRTIVLVFFTTFILALAYLGYWWMQPDRRNKVRSSDGPSKPLVQRPKDTDKPYGPGSGAYVNRYDTETAALVSRFKADDYKPRNDGWVEVKNPRAQFFMSDRRAISIEGDSGEIVMDDGNKTGARALSGSRDTPSRGRLHNVVIKLFHGITQPAVQLDDALLALPDGDPRKPHSALTITLENAAFNNESFKITSEAFKNRNTGKRVEADQVPVVLRGDEYDFDGQGLTILWNERDRRLQYLEVAHGKTLTIKHPSQVMKSDQPEPTVAGLDEGAGIFSPLDGNSWLTKIPRLTPFFEGPLPEFLVARGRGGAGEAIKSATSPAPTSEPTTGPSGRRGKSTAVPKPKIRPNTDPPLYLATFHDNVHINQGSELNVDSDLMTIQFLMQDQEHSDSATTKPSTRPTTRPAKVAGTTAGAAVGATGGARPVVENPAVAGGNATSPAAAVPATQPTTRPAAGAKAVVAATQTGSRRSPKRAFSGTMPATLPASPAVAATQPSDEVPVVITWTGPLTIKPLSAEPESPIRSGDAVIRLEGAPVVANQQGSIIECGILTYRTKDQAMNLMPIGPDKPVVLRDVRGSIVRTTSMDFSQAEHMAVLYGNSNALFPQEDENGKPAAPLTCKWVKTCTLYFAPNEPTSGPATQPTAPGRNQPALAGAILTTQPATGPAVAAATSRPARQRGSGEAMGALNIERAKLNGDVYVDRPGQLKLRSQELELSFDTSKKAPTTRPVGPAVAAQAGGGQAGAGHAPVARAAEPAPKSEAAAPIAGDPRIAILSGRREALKTELNRAQTELEAITRGQDLNTQQTALIKQMDATDTRIREIERRMLAIAASNQPGTAAEGKALSEELPNRRTFRASLQEELNKLAQQMMASESLAKLVEATKLEIAKLDQTLAAKTPEAVSVAAINPPADPKAIAAAGHPAATGPSTRPAAAPAMRSDLKQMIATGTVHCELTDSSNKTQTIDCNQLTLQTALTPDGRSYPHTVTAVGDVHAVDTEQDLRAGHLAVTMRPATRPSIARATTRSTTNPAGNLAGNPTTGPALAGGAGGGGAMGGDTASAQLESLLASSNVRVIGKDGTQAMADQLLVDNKDGKNILKLLGQPYATVIDKKNTLTGPTIVMFPDEQKLQVYGPGTMKGYQQAGASPFGGAAGPTTAPTTAPTAGGPQGPRPTDVAGGAGGAELPHPAGAAAPANPTTHPTTQPAPERPIDVSWTQSLFADGKANTVDVTGQVVTITKDADGAVNTAKGQRVKMILADAAPTTKPTTQASTQATQTAAGGAAVATGSAPAATQLALANSATQPSTKPSKGPQMGAMGNKTVKHITFLDDAEVSSVTLADDQTLLRRTHLMASNIQYDMAAHQMIIPVEGRMIVEDHRPSTQPAAKPAGGDGAAAGGEPNAENNRGTSAFQWSKSFIYDETTRLATMLGDDRNQVIIVHQDEKDEKKQFRMTANQVNAEMEEATAAQPKTPAAPGADPASKPATKPSNEQKMQMKRVTATGNLHFTGPGADILANEMEYNPKNHTMAARGDGRNPVVFTIASSPGGQKQADYIRYNTETGAIEDSSNVFIRAPR